jgi:hypothetical protein
MNDFAIRNRMLTDHLPCGFCGSQTMFAAGPELYLMDSSEPVCRDCGRKAAPQLAALLKLAHVAQRVGRIKRHTLMPPLEALLELAGAAEVYAEHTALPGTGLKCRRTPDAVLSAP